jgi:predicted naringenin-chalcone synthase
MAPVRPVSSRCRSWIAKPSRLRDVFRHTDAVSPHTDRRILHDNAARRMARVLLVGPRSMDRLALFDFRMQRPPLEVDQARSLQWILEGHVESEEASAGLDAAARGKLKSRLRKIVSRCACDPSRIRSRGYTLSDVREIYDVARYPHGKGALERMRVYEREAARYFEQAYRDGDGDPPSDIVHVTCTGYVAPSGAQALVARLGWGERTRVTHAYHMGCYAAIPALRIAAGCIGTSQAVAPRVDVMHTELCTLHIDPADHTIEQIVVQSLFADGCIRYSVDREPNGPSLSCIATSERIVPDSGASMRWVMSDWGMQMTLARDIPERVGGVIRAFVSDLLGRAGVAMRDLPRFQFAVHPGGPRIIDGVRQMLELDESQVAISRGVLLDYGNMSSATLPHVWQRMLESQDVARGTPIVSLAFGPGLTVCGAVFVKV